MGTPGQLLRLRRFYFKNSRVGLIIPIDHGLTLGPLPGIDSLAAIGQWLHNPAITGIIAHKGMVERLAAANLLSNIGVMIHLNGMNSGSENANRKEMLTSMEAALRLGADGISIQVNFDGTTDAHNLSLLGSVVDEAQRYGLPVLSMVYDKVVSATKEQSIARLKHLMRIAVELGSDALKIAPPVDHQMIPEILSGLADHTPVFFAGGDVGRDDEVCNLARRAVSNGGAGLCVGRNVFQSPSPNHTLEKLAVALRPRGFAKNIPSNLSTQRTALPLAIEVNAP